MARGFLVTVDMDGAIDSISYGDSGQTWSGLTIDDDGTLYGLRGDEPPQITRLDEHGKVVQAAVVANRTWRLRWVDDVIVGFRPEHVTAWNPDLTLAPMPPALREPDLSAVAATPQLLAWSFMDPRHQQVARVRGPGGTHTIDLPDGGRNRVVSGLSVAADSGHALVNTAPLFSEQWLIRFDSTGDARQVDRGPEPWFVHAIATSEGGSLAAAGAMNIDGGSHGWIQVHDRGGHLGWAGAIEPFAEVTRIFTDVPVFGVHPRRIVFTNDGGFVVAGTQDSALAWVCRYVPVVPAG